MTGGYRPIRAPGLGPELESLGPPGVPGRSSRRVLSATPSPWLSGDCESNLHLTSKSRRKGSLLDFRVSPYVACALAWKERGPGPFVHVSYFCPRSLVSTIGESEGKSVYVLFVHEKYVQEGSGVRLAVPLSCFYVGLLACSLSSSTDCGSTGKHVKTFSRSCRPCCRSHIESVGVDPFQQPQNVESVREPRHRTN